MISLELQRGMLCANRARQRRAYVEPCREVAFDSRELGEELVFLRRDAKCIVKDGLCDEVGHVEGCSEVRNASNKVVRTRAIQNSSCAAARGGVQEHTECAMNTCPKCEGTCIIGPRYNKGTNRLDYTCMTCGYSSDAPPADAKKASDADALIRLLGGQHAKG